MAQKYVPVSLRQLVRVRSGERCEYCFIPEALALAPHWVDHIIAVKQGGQTEEENLQLIYGVPSPACSAEGRTTFFSLRTCRSVNRIRNSRPSARRSE
jgi:hypothetical protein